jgi:type I restriction enzyme S subunit
VAIAKNEISTNQGFKSFVCRDAVIAEYLYFWLKYATPLAEELAAGTTFAEISGTNAAKIPVLIPPLLEQRRIVERLEKLLAEVERCNERTTKIPVLLKRFRQSVLASACSGRLTSDWRETRNADSEWPTKPLSDLFIMRNGKSLTVAKRKKGTIPVYGGNGLMGVHSVGNVDGKVIVVGRVGAQCGNVHFTNGKVWVTDNAISLQARYELNPAFYALFLETQNLNQLSAGTGQPYVSQDILSSIEAPIVSLPEQDEITHRVNALFGLADNIEVRFKAVQQQVDRLPLSVLAKAFRGELVPTEAELAKREDRPYESAEELLQRIRHSREAVPPRGSRKRGKGATRSK